MPTAFGPLHMTLRRLGILTAVTGCLLLPQWGMAQAPAKAALKRKTPVRFIRWQPAQNAFLLNKLAKDGDFGRAEYALDKLCDQTIANSRANQTIIIRRADFSREMVEQLGTLPGRHRRLRMLAYLQKHHKLAETLVFLIENQRSVWPKIYAMLAHLHRKLGSQAAEYPNLTAAVCSVLYAPLTVHMNENPATTPDPVNVWKFYVQNQDRMYFGIKHVPAELLVYVVDGTNSIADHRWALAKYRGNSDSGQLFFSINYDYGFLHGHALKIDSAGFTLPNILKYGGVCVDQAYFATEVAKDIGVPSAVDEAMGNSAGHAWAGFLQARGRVGWWNFLSGRYREFRGIQGHVLNPQTRRDEPDAYISLSAQLIHTTAHDRWDAAALTDAATRLAVLALKGKTFHAPALPKYVHDIRTAPRVANITEAQSLLHRAVVACDGYAPAWLQVRDLAERGKLRFGEKLAWSQSVIRLCGHRYPDFAMAVLAPMILTVKNVHEQNSLWNRLFSMFSQSRFDLAGEVRMFQATMWKKAGKLDRAGQCYMDIINRFASDGPFVMGAIEGAQNVLESQGHKARVLRLWEIAWQNITPPAGDLGTFVTESMWYQVGERLKQKLAAAGHPKQAAQVGAKLKSLLASAGAGG